MEDIEPYNLNFRTQNALWRMYWINKLGNFPTKIEKIIVKVSWKEKDEQQEKLNNDFKEFVNKYLNDSVFRKKFSEG